MAMPMPTQATDVIDIDGIGESCRSTKQWICWFSVMARIKVRVRNSVMVTLRVDVKEYCDYFSVPHCNYEDILRSSEFGMTGD